MARRRRRKPANTTTATPQPKKKAAAKANDSKAPSTAQAPRGGKRKRSPSRRSPRKPIGVRLAGLIESFPPSIDKLTEYLNICRDLNTAVKKHEFTEVSEEEVFYLFASGIETLAEEELDRLFDSKYKEQLEKIRVDHGLGENEFWKPENSRIPEEYLQTLDEFRAEKRTLLAGLFRQHGEQEAADLVENDYSAYQARRTRGKEAFFARIPHDTLKLPDVVIESPAEEQEANTTLAPESNQ